MIAYGLSIHLACVGQSRNEKYIKAFGQHVKSLRNSQGLSREAVAAMADIEVMQVYRIETGRVNTTISTLEAVARALKLHPKELLDFDY